MDTIKKGSKVTKLLDKKNKKHTFPWMVRIVGQCGGKYPPLTSCPDLHCPDLPGRLCGGSLISPRLVASAFHCAQASKHPDQVPASSLLVHRRQNLRTIVPIYLLTAPDQGV